MIMSLLEKRPTGTHRGFGFITFESKDLANAALNNKYHEFNGSQVEVKLVNLMVRNDHVRHCKFVDWTDLSCYVGYFPGCNWYGQGYTTIYDYNNGMVGIPIYEQGAV
ncbi:hypothetical protein LINPERHAP2_LOCUS35236 [Linum perenne]